MITYEVGTSIQLNVGNPVWIRKSALKISNTPPTNLIRENEENYLIDLNPDLAKCPAHIIGIVNGGRAYEVVSDGFFQRIPADYIRGIFKL